MGSLSLYAPKILVAGVAAAPFLYMAAYAPGAGSLNDKMSVNYSVEAVEKAVLSGSVRFAYGNKVSESPGRLVIKKQIDHLSYLEFPKLVDYSVLEPFAKGSVRTTYERGRPMLVTIASKNEAASIQISLTLAPSEDRSATRLIPTVTFSPGAIPAEQRKDIESNLELLGQDVAIDMVRTLQPALEHPEVNSDYDSV